jgi:D-glycero-alpha-D-manno-heptose-7-phosphate kinase
MLIRSRAPLRLGLAGGGTDVSPYCDQYGGAVLNVTINKFAYCTIETGFNDVLFYDANSNSSGGLESRDARMAIPIGVTKRIISLVGELPGFHMTVYNDAPMGSGLGGSSTMAVTILKCFEEWLKLALGEYDLAHIAWDIERNDLSLAGGKQDQYAAAFGGINYIEFFEGNKVIVNPLRVKRWIQCELEDSLLLYFTGKSRQSAYIIGQQISAIERNDSLQAMHDLKKGAVNMKEAILTGNFAKFADSLNEGWEAKKRTSDAISNDNMDEIYNAVLKAGGKAGKISGAGGGGFFMFFIEPTRREHIKEVLASFGGAVSAVQFTDDGTRGWTR